MAHIYTDDSDFSNLKCSYSKGGQRIQTVLCQQKLRKQKRYEYTKYHALKHVYTQLEDLHQPYSWSISGVYCPPACPAHKYDTHTNSHAETPTHSPRFHRPRIAGCPRWWWHNTRFVHTIITQALSEGSVLHSIIIACLR